MQISDSSETDNSNELFKFINYRFKMINIMSLFEHKISEHPYYYYISDYLNIKDNIKLLTLCKSMYNNPINRQFTARTIIKKASLIITKFMKKYTAYMLNINNLIEDIDSRLEQYAPKKIVAAYYFRNYEKQYINGWYNMNSDWKKDLVDTYKTHYTDTPTRLDLFNLIRVMPVYDVYSVGW